MKKSKILEIAKYYVIVDKDVKLYDLREIADEDYYDEDDDCGFLFLTYQEMKNFLFEEYDEKFTLKKLGTLEV